MLFFWMMSHSEWVCHDWFVFAEVIVMLVPCEGSETYVNGKRVEDAIQLRSGMCRKFFSTETVNICT